MGYPVSTIYWSHFKVSKILEYLDIRENLNKMGGKKWEINARCVVIRPKDMSWFSCIGVNKMFRLRKVCLFFIVQNCITTANYVINHQKLLSSFCWFSGSIFYLQHHQFCSLLTNYLFFFKFKFKICQRLLLCIMCLIFLK